MEIVINFKKLRLHDISYRKYYFEGNKALSFYFWSFATIGSNKS
jgi:hypothetical protein